LLNWMKRMIRLRKTHPVFGRGDFRFVLPADERILAYLRSYAGETVLVVVNLSGSSQTPALDLAGFAGATPLDLLTEGRLPPIGPGLYTMQLPPYGYRWLKLGQVARPSTG